MDVDMTTEAAPQFGPPTFIDIVLAPVLVMVALVAGILLQSFFSQPKWWRMRFCSIVHTPQRKLKPAFMGKENHLPGNDFLFYDGPVFSSKTKIHPIPGIDDLLTKCDYDILNRFQAFQNNPWSLFGIALPVLLSLLFCPVTIIVNPILSEFFWPEALTGGMPVINDVVSAFLMPAGLVYAIAFGFALQDVLMKKDDVRKDLLQQQTLFRQIWQLVKSNDYGEKVNTDVAKNLKDVAVSWMSEVIGMKKCHTKGTLWHVLHTIRNQLRIKNGNSSDVLKEKISENILSHILELDSCLHHGHEKNERNIKIMQWVFLELLGFITFFGVILIKAGSYRLELTMCMLTVFTISAFSFVLADLDSVYHGTFKLSLSSFSDFVLQLQAEYSLLAVKSKNEV